MMKNLFFLFLWLSFSCVGKNSNAEIYSTNKPVITDKEYALNKPQADTIINANKEFKGLKLVQIIQSRSSYSADEKTVYDKAINSPKSVIYSKDASKFYINSLEGFVTVVYDAKTFKKLKEIRHEFNENHAYLFKNNENTIFEYPYKQKKSEYNHFAGKPVEGCLSHDGKYLWVTYYRRSWDPKAESPSAIAIIDTEKDEIVRVMPSGPLPKMISSAPDGKYVAVTHWGDNTVGLIDTSSRNVMDFKYTDHIVIDYKVAMNFTSNTNRDSDCGNCLRGTVFTPDGQKILVGKMGGDGIAIIDVNEKKYEGTITGARRNIRHLIIHNHHLYLSSNKEGVVQKANLDELLSTPTDEAQKKPFHQWESTRVGYGARTIDITKDGRYIFVCVNNDSKIVVVEAASMQIISEMPVASFPVGMAISPDGSQLVITSQGKSGHPGTGNTVTIFQIEYK